MQLDLLYKGLPSAKADTRKFGVQIHSNAISFIQHEGGGGGRGRGLYTRPPPSASPPAPALGAPPAPSVGSPSHPAPRRRMGAKKMGEKKEKEAAGTVLPSPTRGEQRRDPPSPRPLAPPGLHQARPRARQGVSLGLRGSPNPRFWPRSPPCTTFPGQKPRFGAFSGAGRACKQSKETLWFNAVGAPLPAAPQPLPLGSLPHPGSTNSSYPATKKKNKK